MFKYFIVISTCLFLVNCQSTKNGYYDNKNTGDLFSTRSLQSNLEFLASDELEGREAATDAEKVASKFIASELKEYGIQTLNGAEDYFQEIKLRKINYRKLLNVTRLSYEIARAAANRENRFRSDGIAGN